MEHVIKAHESINACTTQMLWGGIFERRKREKREREILSQVWDIR
jgi:hypothetical protein